jgi:hypothetical protein
MSEEPNPEQGASSDEYVSKYMEGGSAIAISKKRVPSWWFLLFASPALSGLGLIVAGFAKGGVASVLGASLAGLFLLAFSAVMGLMFSHLRMVVTERVVHVQLGVFGPKIPIERIKSVTTGVYQWTRFGGWGIRYGRDGSVCYSVPGGSGQCVEVEWVDEKGRTVRHVITVDDAVAVAATIERAREAAIATSGTGVRVADSEPSVAAEEAVDAQRASDEARKGRA